LVHGQQELALFNTHAGGTCFQPIHIFEAGSGKPILSLLRPGKRPSGEEIARVLAHVIRHIRRRWPQVAILVRGDSHYCAPEVLDLLHKKGRDYWTITEQDARCTGRALARAMPLALETGPQGAPLPSIQYAAESWSRQEKVVARVEATELGTDARFIVTNLTGRGKHLYEKVYCARRCMENLIKDMKLSTRSDKTACSRWQANQFRLFLHMGAYWLLHSVRMAAPKRSRWRGATFATIRSAFVKIAVRVEELKRSIKLAFPRNLPNADALALVTGRLTAEGSRPTRPHAARATNNPSNACHSVLPPTAVHPADPARLSLPASRRATTANRMG
jgi:hypothetical protein